MSNAQGPVSRARNPLLKVAVGGFLAALTLSVGVSGWSDDAFAQKKGKQKQEQKQEPAKEEPSAAQAQSAWVKLCEKATLRKQEKEEKLDICLTHHERLDGATGMVIVSAALRDVEKSPKKHLMVMVPLGVALPAGVQIKIDDEKEATKLAYTICHPGGCTAEVEASDALIEKMKNGKQMVVAAMNVAAKPIFLPVPLKGFAQTLGGKPVDPKVYSEARGQLMQQIYQRQQELLKKAQEDAQKGNQTSTGSTEPAPDPKGKRK